MFLLGEARKKSKRSTSLTQTLVQATSLFISQTFSGGALMSIDAFILFKTSTPSLLIIKRIRGFKMLGVPDARYSKNQLEIGVPVPNTRMIKIKEAIL
jgi:hypothetical protein